MFKFLKRMRKKLFTDRADSILVPALILAPVMAITLGISVEVVKNAYVKSERVSAIQDAASSAVSLTDTRGSLNWTVVDRVVNEYEHNRYGKRLFSSTDNSRLKYDAGSSKESAESTIFDDSTKTNEGCFIGHGDDAGQKYPQYKITLNTARGDKAVASAARTVSFTRTQPTVQQLNAMAPLNARDAKGKIIPYRSVTVEVIDQTPNIVMSMLGSPCQKFDLTASAVTFGVNSDLP